MLFQSIYIKKQKLKSKLKSIFFLNQSARLADRTSNFSVTDTPNESDDITRENSPISIIFMIASSCQQAVISSVDVIIVLQINRSH